MTEKEFIEACDLLFGEMIEMPLEEFARMLRAEALNTAENGIEHMFSTQSLVWDIDHAINSIDKW